MHLFGTTGERVLVIGAGGALGSLTACAFESAGWDVVRATRSTVPPDWRRLDLDRPEDVGPGLADVDVVVNTVPHARLTAERFVLERGGLLINTSALPTALVRRLSAEQHGDAGTVIVGAGIAPGITNLVAAKLLAERPDADELEIVFTFSAVATSGPAGTRFVHRHLTAVSAHDTIEVPLPPPLGTRECLGFAEPERGWIGDLAGARAVRSYACFVEPGMQDALLALNRLGTITELPQPGAQRHGQSKGHQRIKVSSEPVAHWICVRRGGKRIAAMTICCEGDYVGAAHATLALAEALQDARAKARLPTGVFGPEDLVELAQVDPYLAAASIRVHEAELRWR